VLVMRQGQLSQETLAASPMAKVTIPISHESGQMWRPQTYRFCGLQLIEWSKSLPQSGQAHPRFA
jgi:hypothetical protein